MNGEQSRRTGLHMNLRWRWTFILFLLTFSYPHRTHVYVGIAVKRSSKKIRCFTRYFWPIVWSCIFFYGDAHCMVSRTGRSSMDRFAPVSDLFLVHHSLSTADNRGELACMRIYGSRARVSCFCQRCCSRNACTWIAAFLLRTIKRAVIFFAYQQKNSHVQHSPFFANVSIPVRKFEQRVSGDRHRFEII